MATARRGSASSNTSALFLPSATCALSDRSCRPYGFEVPYKELFTGFEDIVIRHGGRPHWAKAHNMRPDDLRALYPRFDDFVRVLDEVDPQGMFRNEYVQRHIYGQQGDTADKYKK